MQRIKYVKIEEPTDDFVSDNDKEKVKPTSNLVSEDVFEAIQLCRPLRLFIDKQKKKGNENKGFALRSKFGQLSAEKKLKYCQKAVDKYIRLLDEKKINERVQIDAQLFENVLSKKEQGIYFQSLDAPTKPLYSAAAYYSDAKKNEHDPKAKAWKDMSNDQKKPYIQMFNDAKAEYSAEVRKFAESLPERLKPEYLSFLHPISHPNENDDENPNPGSITQRRRSVQSLPESFKTAESDNPQKLTRTQLDDLHKCKPSLLYYEKKVPDDEKPTFEHTLQKLAHIRSVFNQISEKKRHKFILKSIKKWEEYLQSNPTIIEHQIPTLYLLLGKLDDIHYYFSSLGLPTRPPIGAHILFGHEKEKSNSQQNWADLPQTTKDEYIKRLSKMKNEYREKFLEFVDKTLPSDYIRLEFFRTVKFAAKDYDLFTKDRVNNKDEGQLKITQYLTPKKKGQSDVNEFDRIKQQLLATQLNNEQKKLVERLGQIMNKHIEETTVSKNESSNSKTGATKSNSSSSKRKSTDSADVMIINGDLSSDNIEHTHKKKKKHKRDRNDDEEKKEKTTATKTRK